VVGASNASAGVIGVSGSYVGVSGTGLLAGVYGISSAGGNNVGVHGASANSFGVYGNSSGYIGVFGSSGQYWGPFPTTFDQFPGIWGTSRDHNGVLGTSTNLAGVVGCSQTQIGVYGETGATDGNYAGYFKGNLFVSGHIATGTGIMDSIVPFSDGSRRLMHCMESPEHWFEDFGAAKLKRGRAVVKLDADFAKTIRTSDYRVFLTPEGDCGGLYIKSKRGDGFEVRELQGGTSNVAFSYRIVGRRRDIKRHQRFAKIDITPPMQITKSRTVGQPAARAQAVARKLRAAMEKHVAAVATKPARGRKGRSRRQRKARA
jgi:hypothetical protein